MAFLLSTYLIVIGFFLAGVPFQCLLLRLFRIKIKEIRIFFGPSLFSWNFGGHLPVNVGCIPIGCSVAFDQEAMQAKALATRWLIHSSVGIFYLALAHLLLGSTESAHHFLTAFWQVPSGAWAPVSTAARHLRQWSEVLAASPFVAAGIVAAKLGAYHFLPIGGTAVTQIAADLASSTGRESLEKYAVFNALIGILIGCLWVFAACYLAIAE